MPHIPYRPRKANPARLAPQAMAAAQPKPAAKPRAKAKLKTQPERNPEQPASPRDTHEVLPVINMAEYRMDVDEVLAKMFGKEQLRG